MIRLDMSEYQQQDSISKLIGDPNGNSKGVLTEAVRSRPYALILLDEIEKAYSSVLLTFLQVLDDGRLTDSSGLTIDFTNTIIIATSNVGTRSIQEVMSKNGTSVEMSEAALKDVREHYAPEFLNRFNGLIVFNPLTKEVVTKITDILLNRVRKMADERGIKISFKKEMIEELVNRGYNPEWGARPMARAIEDTVESYLAVKLLSKELNMGDEIELGLEVFE
jgi:ATP-dependent Clp protease ATP-binding subunit ClpB